jgi:cytochrome c biogenesis protein CcdA
MEWLLPLTSALWLGILTSISPCPLASNIAAISYMTREVDRPRQVFLSGLLYSLGRSISYVCLGALIAGSLLSIPDVAFFLQSRVNQILGPILILAGIILLGWIRVNVPGLTLAEKSVSRLKSLGSLGSLLLGVIFALSFCPVSAGLFFGSLIPLSIQQNAPFTLPLAYGVGTGLPVLGFALAIAFGAKGLDKLFHRTSRLEAWLRKLTGWIFLLVGIYFVYFHIMVPLLRRG